jgi:hypothetical protein
MMRLALAGACALLLISGCGGDDADDDTAGGGSTPTPTATETAAAPPEDGTATATATATPSEAVASKEETISETPVRLELLSLRRAGELAELELRLTNLQEPETGADRFQTGGLFDGPEIEDDYSVDGIYLIDPVNRKKYPVAVDAEGICVCSALAGDLLEPGDSIALTATYGAPPDDVTQVDVSVPKFGTFRDVPLG